MDPTTIAALIGGASKVLGAGIDSQRQPTPPNQRADGSAMGGLSDGANSGGATGGAYGGSYSQNFLDGSNWVVATGKSNARADAQTSGAKPIFSTETPQMYAPQNPFLAMNPTRGTRELPSLSERIGDTTGNMGSGQYLLIGLVLLTFVLLQQK